MSALTKPWWSGSRPLLALVLAAVSVRWFFCLIAYPLVLYRHTLTGSTYFFDHYLPFAQNLLAGHGYCIAPGGPAVLDRPPGYLAVMLPVAASGAHAALIMHLLHGLLGGLAVCLTVALARRTGLGGRASFLAGGLVAFWPFLIWETKVSVPENLLVALVPAVLLAFVRWHQGNGVGWAVLLGALAGWATLTHGLYQVLLPVLLVAVLSVGVPWRRRLAGAAALVLAAAAVVTPWTLHTSNAAGRWIGVATGLGHHYLKGVKTFALLARPADYFTDIEGMLGKEMRSLVAREGFDSLDDTLIRSDPAINRRLDELARADLRARPVPAALRTVARVPIFWVQQQSVLRAVLTAALLAPLFSLAVRGLRRSGRASDWTAAAMLLAINLAAAAVFIEARPMRYALPLMPLLAVLAARGLDNPHLSSPLGSIRSAGAAVAARPSRR